MEKAERNASSLVTDDELFPERSKDDAGSSATRYNPRFNSARRHRDTSRSVTCHELSHAAFYHRDGSYARLAFANFSKYP